MPRARGVRSATIDAPARPEREVRARDFGDPVGGGRRTCEDMMPPPMIQPWGDGRHDEPTRRALGLRPLALAAMLFAWLSVGGYGLVRLIG